MNFLRPATPGFIVTFVATILLLVVTFSVPWFKSVYFLKASLSVENISGNVTFGTLGYCLQLSNGTTCSKPSVGYQLDINSLVGDNLPIKIPEVVVKWITYALVLHPVALVLAAISALFGLLAHVREMSMTCFSSCISGFAATVAFFAFIFDLVLFFIARSRMNSVSGGSATMGSAIWLTLVAWLLLFFSGCFYSIGRCCIRRRPSGFGRTRNNDAERNGYEEQMRLDAVKAEADRKTRQKQSEVGLPAFNELARDDPTKPLYAHIDGDHVYDDEHAPYQDNATATAAPPATNTTQHAGYVQAPAGTRAVDEYYNPTQPTYPPQPRRQGSGSTYAHSQYPSYNQPNYPAQNPMPAPYGQSSHTPMPSSSTVPPGQPSYMTTPYAAAAATGYVPARQPSQGYGVAQTSYSPPTTTLSQPYGHAAGGTSYHSNFENPYDAPRRQGSYNDPYSQRPSPSAVYQSALATPAQPQRMPSPGAASAHPSDRSYTLGGTAYPNPHNQPESYHVGSSETPYTAGAYTTAIPPINTASGSGFVGQQRTTSPEHRSDLTSPIRGPRAQQSQHEAVPTDEPPMYDAGPSAYEAPWPEKR